MPELGLHVRHSNAPAIVAHDSQWFLVATFLSSIRFTMELIFGIKNRSIWTRAHLAFWHIIS